MSLPSDVAAHKPLVPLTMDHWRAYARLMVLDSGEKWVPEPFQDEIIAEILSGLPEVWVDIPEGNGKTTLMGGLALYHGDHTESASVPMAASSRDQTGLLLGQASGFVRRSPGLRKRFRVYEGYRRIKCLRTGGVIQVFAADDRTGDGVIPSLALVDELHRHPSLRLYRTWRGKLEKRGGQLVSISTAGEALSEYEEAKTAALLTSPDVSRDGCHTVARAPDFVLHQHALRVTEDTEDLELVKRANPFTGVTLEGLRKKRASPAMRPEHWARFACGIAVATETPWILPEDWDACKGDLADMDSLVRYAGVDIGQVRDSSAIAEAAWVGEKLHVRVRVWDPGPGRPVLIAEPAAHLTRIAETGMLREFAYDPVRFNESAESLADRGLRAVVFPQTNARMVQASSTLYDLIKEGRVVHDGDLVLRAHVLAAVAMETESGWRVSKLKTKQKIDALVALVMAAQRAADDANVPEPFVEVF